MSVESEEAPLYASYMLYAATGEGLTVTIALASGAHYAETVLKEKVAPYYHPASCLRRIRSVNTCRGLIG